MEEKIIKIFDGDKISFEKISDRLISFYVYKSPFDPCITFEQLNAVVELTGDKSFAIMANSKYIFNIICDLTNGKN